MPPRLSGGEFLESRYGGSLRAMLDDAVMIGEQITNILKPEERNSRDLVRCCLGYAVLNGIDTFEDAYEAGVPVEDIIV